MLEPKQKALHFVLPIAGAAVPYVLAEFADAHVEKYLMDNGKIMHPAQVHGYQRPSAVVPLAVGIPMLLGVVFDLVKDPAKQLMMLEFAGPMIFGGCWSAAKHFQLQRQFIAGGGSMNGAAAASPGAVQTGRRVFYGQVPRQTTYGGYPRPTFGSR